MHLWGETTLSAAERNRFVLKTCDERDLDLSWALQALSKGCVWVCVWICQRQATARAACACVWFLSPLTNCIQHLFVCSMSQPPTLIYTRTVCVSVLLMPNDVHVIEFHRLNQNEGEDAAGKVFIAFASWERNNLWAFGNWLLGLADTWINMAFSENAINSYQGWWL